MAKVEGSSIRLMVISHIPATTTKMGFEKGTSGNTKVSLPFNCMHRSSVEDNERIPKTWFLTK